MKLKNKRLIAVATLAAFSQIACYNTYFIQKPELQKLESQVEQKEVVVVYGDCAETTTASNTAVEMDGTMWAEAAPVAQGDTASDATSTTGSPEPAERAGCTRVPVSTANAVNVVSTDGETFRVTPFNFMMSDQQLVSPEYDLLMNLDQVKGAEVQEFSTWKTVSTIVGVSVVAIGTFVGISVLAPDGRGFE
ncbi:hypothetical protein [Bradymonas sediminis]|uniref:Uncharacterized protein n=1 Tax=Bradymonas sediminis TaxID=1548548 RepID=A0A2Z4FJN5_9DELT|nr:hypothetical protein [Bradymonas sediminis]AWV89153.1 hypothetical protein DN745_07300 [Bradymonas sediminis]TDP64381.1 hypothetical protein DFR33_10942 [Bradymonas sediminis]